MPDLAVCGVQSIRRDHVRVVVTMIRCKFLEAKKALKTLCWNYVLIASAATKTYHQTQEKQ